MKPIAKAVRDAIMQELVDRGHDEYIALKPAAFEIAIEPNVPVISITTSDGFDKRYGVMDIAFASMADIIDKVNELRFKTLREGQSGDFSDHRYLEAANWEDMVHGLNQVLSEKNRIDPNVLGRGK